MKLTDQELNATPDQFPLVPADMHPTFLEQECGRQFKLKNPDWSRIPAEQLKPRWDAFHREFMDQAVAKGIIASWFPVD